MSSLSLFYTHFNPKKRIGNVNEMGVFVVLAESTIQCSEAPSPSQGVQTGIVCRKETGRKNKMGKKDRTKGVGKLMKEGKGVFYPTAVT
jgi:hypothetical protein